MIKTRFVLLVLAALSALAVVAGCGGGGVSSSDPASLAPPESPVFIEGTVRPAGALKSNVDALSERIAGIDKLGDFVVSELESSARADGQPFDYAKEVEPWLGERAGVFFEKLQDGDLSGTGVLVGSTDTAATQKFIDAQVAASDKPFSERSYEGVDFELGGSEDQAVGVVGDFLVIAEDEQAFKDAVDASNGDSLAGEDRFSSAISAASDGSLADVYVDVGGLIDQSGGEIDPQVRQFLQSAGIDPSDATAVASVVPGSDQVEVDLSSNLGGETAPSGDASELLGSLPADSFAAFATSGFGDQLSEALDSLDAEGISGTVPPHQLKKGLKEVGIDLEGIAGSLEAAGLFAVGSTESTLGGALVLTTSGSKATDAIDSIGKLLRGVHVEGVTPLRGNLNGFSVRSAELGPKPLVVAAKDGRLVIGYGLPPTLQALAAATGRTLSDNPDYAAAAASLGDTPISGFVDGPAALRLAESLVPPSETGFQKAKRYLRSIRFIGLGTASEGDLATAKLIVGINK